MFKKIASIALAAMMMLSTAAFAVSAAEESSAVAADESSAVAADSSSEVGAGKVIYFDAKSAGWDKLITSKNVACAHIYRVDGTGNWPGWQSNAERCTYDAATGIATYDMQKAIDKGFDMGEIGPNNEWCVIFSVKNVGCETYPVLMNSNCFGDTVYVPDVNKKLENNVDSEKSSVETKWKKNTKLSAAKTITSTGKLQGTAHAYGETDETILASYLISYALDTDKLALTQDLVNQLKVSPVSVWGVVQYKQDEAVKSGGKTADIVKDENASIEKTLLGCTDPTKGGEKVDKEAMDKQEAVKNPSKPSGGSSNKTNGNSNGSVSSGQETTVFFVFGGLMIAAAGVLFLARKREF
jgi:LPXTG-motif cell wall-anchored protein